jgi:hypothetical protein
MGREVSNFICSIGSLFARTYIHGANAPTWGEVENLLTDGYARALSLDSERFRIERRIFALNAARNGGPDPAELRSLKARHQRLGRDVEVLRTLLGELHAYGRELRVSTGVQVAI